METNIKLSLACVPWRFNQFSRRVWGPGPSPRQVAGSSRSLTRARSISDRCEPSAAPQPGGLSQWPPQPSPGAVGRTGHLQPAAELLHRAPAGGHRIAQQEHRDAPLLNQPPQHRILSISGPATEWKGARSVSSESPSPRTTPRPF